MLLQRCATTLSVRSNNVVLWPLVSIKTTFQVRLKTTFQIRPKPTFQVRTFVDSQVCCYNVVSTFQQRCALAPGKLRKLVKVRCFNVVSTFQQLCALGQLGLKIMFQVRLKTTFQIFPKNL
jgi:hypothetical protein